MTRGWHAKVRTLGPEVHIRHASAARLTASILAATGRLIGEAEDRTPDPLGACAPYGHMDK